MNRSKVISRTIQPLQDTLGVTLVFLSLSTRAVIALQNVLTTTLAKAQARNRSSSQWETMLIEWVDSKDMLKVRQRFARLIANGIPPEHAFKMVIR